ncbi:DUF2293 domain-containing protein [Cohaesibacter gelatinilyticus]|uniref:DUF2293 domain-containing protein n=1 Tax=Cohaesibacter gelatinilyticus TaxID=372072 RepID=A0A285NDQ8_9HYPH|nr:DUF2293 domain-containing protein [Cohaesibacter gelatinilyticus]SNZ07438.1 hypothetical protein SAMN06265368_0959 [Cohaesibacter gelatinilyticus]
MAKKALIHQTKQFQHSQVEATIARHFPNCPSDHADQILEKVMKRAWTKKTSLTKAVAIVAHNHIRHELTDYESLLQISGMTREDARLIVKPEVDDWFDFWSSGSRL